MSRLDEKRFKALGQEWIARFDFNATCAIEEETGKGFYEFVAPLLVQLDKDDAKDPTKVLGAVKAIRQSDVRLVLYHALSGAHDVTPELVGDIIQEIGTAEAMRLVVWAIVQAMPTAEDNGRPEGNGTARSAASPNRKARRAAAANG